MSSVSAVLAGVIVVAAIGRWAWTRRDVVGRPEHEWHYAGENKATWLLLVFVLQFFGTVAHLLRVRPRLEADARAHRESLRA